MTSCHKMDTREKGSRKSVLNYFHGIPPYIVNLFFHTCIYIFFITYLPIRSNMLVGLVYGV